MRREFAPRLLCKANQDKIVIEAIDVVFKAYRAEKGIKMKE